MTNAEMLAWLREKLNQCKKSLVARKQMESTWKSGSEKSWQSVGCRMNQKQRFEESSLHGKIAVKVQRDVKMIEAIIAAISK